MSDSRDAFRSAQERLDTKVTILTWLVDLVAALGVLGLLLHA